MIERYIWWRRLTLRGRRYFWHFKTANNEVVFQGLSRGYADRRDMLRAIEVAKDSRNAPVEEAS